MRREAHRCTFRKAIALEVLVFGKHSPNSGMRSSCLSAPSTDASAARAISGLG